MNIGILLVSFLVQVGEPAYKDATCICMQRKEGGSMCLGIIENMQKLKKPFNTIPTDCKWL